MALDVAPALPLRWLKALTAPADPADYLAQLWQGRSFRGIPARIEGIERQTRDAVTLSLRPGRGWDGHRAGQYLPVTVTVDGVRHTRCYSISSAPSSVNECFTITVKAIADGRVSRYLNERARVGDWLEIGEAAGDFTWPAAMPETALFISAGSGITPLMSLALDAAARGALPRLTWLHYAPSAEEVIFKARLAELAAAQPRLDLRLVLTREGGERFSAQSLDAACPDWAERPAWACGPAGLLDAVEGLWRDTPGAAALTVERFRPPSHAGGAEVCGGTVQFLRSGTQAGSDGATNLLETAEAAGLVPAHGCRMGICHGCTVALKAGQVRDLRDGRLIREPDERVQICVCAPVGDVALDL